MVKLELTSERKKIIYKKVSPIPLKSLGSLFDYGFLYLISNDAEFTYGEHWFTDTVLILLATRYIFCDNPSSRIAKESFGEQPFSQHKQVDFNFFITFKSEFDWLLMLLQSLLNLSIYYLSALITVNSELLLKLVFWVLIRINWCFQAFIIFIKSWKKLMELIWIVYVAVITIWIPYLDNQWLVI